MESDPNWSEQVRALNLFNETIVHTPPAVAAPLLALQTAHNASAGVNMTTLGVSIAAGAPCHLIHRPSMPSGIRLRVVYP